MGVVISLNPGVEWYEYKDDPYEIQMFAQYSHTLWSSEDLSAYSGKTTIGEYLIILKPMETRSDDWKEEVRNCLYRALGLTCGALFVLILSKLIHMVTKQKLFTVIFMTIFSVLGCIGGYLMLKACETFVDGLQLSIATQAKDYYRSDKNEERIGSELVHYAAIILLVGCGINIINVILFIKFGEGKWIWKDKHQTEVIKIQIIQ